MIKRCPKCGSSFICLAYKWDHDVKNGRHHIVCMNCGTEGIGGKTKTEAEENWNNEKYANANSGLKIFGLEFKK